MGDGNDCGEATDVVTQRNFPPPCLQRICEGDKAGKPHDSWTESELGDTCGIAEGGGGV